MARKDVLVPSGTRRAPTLPCPLQDLLNLAQASLGTANVVFLLGPPGSGKSGLVIDAIAAATDGSPFRVKSDMPAVGEVAPAHTKDAVALMVHKALMRFSLGFPAVTLAKGMKTVKWRYGTPSHYTRQAAEEIATRRLHVVDEVQAMLPFFGQFLHRLKSAHRAVRGAAGFTPASLLRDCGHIFALDPQQSPCREIGVHSVDAQGKVRMRDSSVMMPWTRFMQDFGLPDESVRYHFVVLHGQYRMKGLLYRIMHGAYDPPMVAIIVIAWRACPMLAVCVRLRFVTSRMPLTLLFGWMEAFSGCARGDGVMQVSCGSGRSSQAHGGHRDQRALHHVLQACPRSSARRGGPHD